MFSQAAEVMVPARGETIERGASVASSFEVLRLIEQEGMAGTWAMDLQSGALRWSSGIYRLLGLDPARTKPSAESFMALVHPDDRAAFGRLGWVLSRMGGPQSAFRIIRPDGTIRWLAGRAETIHDRQGVPQRDIGILIDVSDREEGRLALRQSARRLAALAGALGATAWLAAQRDADAGPAASVRLIDQQGQDLGKELKFFDPAGLGKALAQAAATGAPVSIEETAKTVGGQRRIRLLGAYVPAVASGRPEWVGFAWSDQHEPAGDRSGLALADRPAGEEIPGAYVRAARELVSWSAADLAKRAGVSLSTVRRMEDPGDRFRVRGAAYRSVRQVLENAGVGFVHLVDGRLALTLSEPG